MEIPVNTVNHGFVTAPLEARLVDQLPPGARAEMSLELLKGIAEERRTLRATLTKAGPVISGATNRCGVMAEKIAVAEDVS